MFSIYSKWRWLEKQQFDADLNGYLSGNIDETGLFSHTINQNHVGFFFFFVGGGGGRRGEGGGMGLGDRGKYI